MLITESAHFLFAIDFDQALSSNDAGPVLADVLGVTDYPNRVARLAADNLIRPGGELPWLLANDPDFRRVRRDQLIEAGRRVQLKRAVPQFVRLIDGGIRGLHVRPRILSSAPRDLVAAALDGVISARRIVAAELDFDNTSGELAAVRGNPDASGRIVVLDEIARTLGIPFDRVVYIGDGATDADTMMHVNRRYGFTVGASPVVEQVAQCTVISDNACSLLIPVLEQVLRWRRPSISTVLEQSGLRVDAWQHTHTDTVRLAEFEPAAKPAFA